MSVFWRVFCFGFLVSLAVEPATAAEPNKWVSYEGGLGPGRGKHVVFLSGDEEYRSEEGLPMLAKILSQRHGFRSTVLFAVDPETGVIDPKNTASLPGAEALDSADAIVMLLRFRKWPDEAMQHFVKAFEAGKPIIALRTSTHAFQFPAGSKYESYNDFGKRVLGEKWVSHWGRHKQEAAQGVIEPEAKDDPVLRGVADIFGNSDVYEAYPPADARILVRGQVLNGMATDAAPASYRKKRANDGEEQEVNSPMMPVAWTREFKQDSGTTNRIFCTTMGAATDLESEGLRRLLVNAVYWGLEMDVPEKADVSYVGNYRPTMYGFDGFKKGVRPVDHRIKEAAIERNVLKGADILQPRTQPPRAALPPSRLPLRFLPGERIALVGNSLAERMNLFGHFESLLHSRFPMYELAVRNFARPADAVEARQRPGSYTLLDDPLQAFGPDTLLCFFGFNESFAGAAGAAQFRAAYEKYLDETAAQYPRDTEGKPPRMVLVSPIAWEPTGDPLWPDAAERNRDLKIYAQVVADVARDRGLAFIDLFTPTEPLFAARPGVQYTINGCHLNEAGDREVAVLLDRALFGETTPTNLESERFQSLRAAVNDKAWVHMQDYRMLNGWYVYGGRRTFDHDTFPREYLKIRAMAEVRDRYVWELAQGKSPLPPDDSETGELYEPPTRFGAPGQEYSEPKELKYLSPAECIAAMKVPDGFKVELFASEREFPALAKPCQLNFDNRGRLWAGCMPTYPQWKPGDPPPNDRLLIFEDDDADGRADRCKVFYDKLHCPTGFEFWNGGVIVTDLPRVIWLKDTDGDDRADLVVHLFDGVATDDTHHAFGKYEYSHGGLLHALEGVSMSTTIETPWGPVRRQGASGAYAIDPKTFKISHFVTPGYGNPWCYVFTPWGQGIVGDGTGAAQHWDSPLSGAPVDGRRGMDAIFDTQGMRPVVGTEFLYSRNFPAEVQGQLVYSCVINMNGITRFDVRDESAGFKGRRAMRRSVDESSNVRELPDDLLVSTDKSFRPVNPQFGPDGALWFGDWCNAIIGHMQYSQRDPNRDHQHGRIYRLVYTKRPLVEPVVQYGKTELELLEQLREYEPRTRYRARRELADRPREAVLEAVNKWVTTLDPADPEFERLRCEALWAQQRQHAVDVGLLRSALDSKSSDARAAATHLVADERDYLPDALAMLASRVNDSHPRVRVEAVRGLSFFPTMAAVDAALAALDSPQDPWITYTVEHTLGALEPVWIDSFERGPLAADRPQAREFVAALIARNRPGLAAGKFLKVLLNPNSPDYTKDQNCDALAKLPGDRRSGQDVFRRVCSSCHKIGDVGYAFGPDLSDAGKRLSRRDIIDSVIDPSKKVDKKFVATSIVTSEGTTEVGLVIEQNNTSVTLLMAEGKQKTIARDQIDEMTQTNQSSMPENLAATLAPTEFLDVIEYISTRGQED